MLRTHCQTSGVSLTEQDPYNNVVRTAVEAMAAVLGGTQSLHTNSLRRGDRAADRLLGAHRPQHPADPRRGDRHHPRGRPARRLATTSRRSPQSLADEAWALIEEVEALGGMTKAVESGMPKLRIEEAAARRQARVDRGEEVDRRRQQVPARRRVEPVDVRDIDNTEVREQQLARLEQVRADARRRRVRRPRSTRSREGAAGDGNLLGLAIEAARARATVGEISDALEEVFGRHRAEIRTISGVYGARLRGRRGVRGASATKSTRSPRPRAAARGCSWRSSARTATTAAPR